METCTFRPELEKIKKIYPQIFIFREIELFSSNSKKFQEAETLKKNPYIPGNRNPKNVSYILRNGTFQSTPRKFPIL